MILPEIDTSLSAVVSPAYFTITLLASFGLNTLLLRTPLVDDYIVESFPVIYKSVIVVESTRENV